MKKIIIFLITSMFFFGQASALDLGMRVGVAGSTAVFHAEGEENENGEKSKEDATGIADYASGFVEANQRSAERQVELHSRVRRAFDPH